MCIYIYFGSRKTTNIHFVAVFDKVTTYFISCGLKHDQQHIRMKFY